MAGAFRKGKSFLLNFFLEYLYALQKTQQNGSGPVEWLADDSYQVHGFHWRSGAKRDTVGIWVWGEPIMIEAASGEVYAVLLVRGTFSEAVFSFQMDTQGTFDNNSTYNSCMTVFALSTIASCVQVGILLRLSDTHTRYTTWSTTSRRTPSSTCPSSSNTAVWHFERHISSESPSRPSSFASVISKMQMSTRTGKRVATSSCRASLRSMGRCPPTKNIQTSEDQPEELRSVREQLNDCFETTTCFLLPYPGHRVGSLLFETANYLQVAERQSFRGHIRDIRSLFLQEAKKMVGSLLHPHALKPKTINGKQVSCKKLIQYFKEYVKCFDGNYLPEPQGLLNANAKLLCLEAAHEAKVAYCRGMDRVG